MLKNVLRSSGWYLVVIGSAVVCTKRDNSGNVIGSYNNSSTANRTSGDSYSSSRETSSKGTTERSNSDTNVYNSTKYGSGSQSCSTRASGSNDGRQSR